MRKSAHGMKRALSGVVAIGVSLSALLLTAPALAAGVAPHEATKSQNQAAQKAFAEADRKFDAKHYDEALSGFRASYEIVASPNTRLMIARALRESGKLADAYTEFEGTIADAHANEHAGKRYEQTASAAKDELDALRRRVGFVKVEVSGESTGATVSIGSRAFDPAALFKPIVVDPGKVSIMVSGADGEEKTKEVNVAAGATEEVSIELEGGGGGSHGGGASSTPASRLEVPPDEPEEKKIEIGPNTKLRTWAWIAGGVGVAGFATFAVFGLMNKSQFNELKDDCPGGNCPPGRSDDIDAGRRYQTLANVGLVVGSVGIATGVTLFVLSRGKTVEEEKPKERYTIRVSPTSIGLRGEF